MNPHFTLGVLDGILKQIKDLEKNVKHVRKTVERICKQESSTKGEKR